MNQGCPKKDCAYFNNPNFCHYHKDGYYFRKDDSRKIQRFKCLSCGKKFSAATHTLEWKQKKRRINNYLFNILSSGVSMRRSAIILRVHRTTIDRKLRYLAQKSRIMHEELLKKIGTNKTVHMQFDDIITTEHTKLKPLAITVAVDAQRRLILGTSVSRIPAFGHLSELAKIKYGKRVSTHKDNLYSMLEKIVPYVKIDAKIETDEHHLYAGVVAKFFPKAKYIQYKGGRGAVVGQGELKKLRRDPLFTLNHTCAMLRANINRLIRKTWCTAKDPRRLEDHLAIYMAYHNYILLKKKT